MFLDFLHSTFIAICQQPNKNACNNSLKHMLLRLLSIDAKHSRQSLKFYNNEVHQFDDDDSCLEIDFSLQFWHICLFVLINWLFMYKRNAVDPTANNTKMITVKAKKLLQASSPEAKIFKSCIRLHEHVFWVSNTYPVVHGVQVSDGQEHEHVLSSQFFPITKQFDFSNTFWQIHSHVALEYTWSLLQSEGCTLQLHWHAVSSAIVRRVQMSSPRELVPVRMIFFHQNNIKYILRRFLKVRTFNNYRSIFWWNCTAGIWSYPTWSLATFYQDLIRSNSC